MGTPVDLAIMAFSAYNGMNARREASNQASYAAWANTQANAVKNAGLQAQQQQEQRQQIREERIKQARIMQAAQNTGVAGSSGEIGAVDSIATQTNANLGYIAGAGARGEAISIFQQDAANARSKGQNAGITAQNNLGLFNLAGNIFSATAGGNSAPKEDKRLLSTDW